jgi:uncharacterized protein YdeI (BOF family)
LDPQQAQETMPKGKCQYNAPGAQDTGIHACPKANENKNVSIRTMCNAKVRHDSYLYHRPPLPAN